jgi:hypothetical protein
VGLGPGVSWKGVTPDFVPHRPDARASGWALMDTDKTVEAVIKPQDTEG